MVFFVGMTINIHSDHVLRNLRKPGETGYKIPRGKGQYYSIKSYVLKLLLVFSFMAGTNVIIFSSVLIDED